VFLEYITITFKKPLFLVRKSGQKERGLLFFWVQWKVCILPKEKKQKKKPLNPEEAAAV
jgi:hypothetical protein